MKRIKNFTLFLESESPKDYPRIVFLKIGIDEDYGNPKMEECEPNEIYSRGEWKNPEYDVEELFEEELEAPHGPIYGSDCWHHVDDAIEEWEDAEDEGEKEEAKESVENWLSGFYLDSEGTPIDIDRFLTDPDYYEEIKGRYIQNCRTHFDSEIYPHEDVWNFIAFVFLPPDRGGLLSGDLQAYGGDLYESVKDSVGDIFICLAYKEGDPAFYLLPGRKKDMIKTPYHKGQSPEQIRDLILKENSDLVTQAIKQASDKALKEILPSLPSEILDAYIKSNPLNLDLLDGSPDIKAGVLQRTGLKDVSNLARSMRKGMV